MLRTTRRTAWCHEVIVGILCAALGSAAGAQTSGSDAVTDFVTAVHAEDWEVRENAFYTLLGSSGLVALGRHAVDRLTGYLGDSNYVYRMVATAVLGEMLGPEKGAPLDPSAVGRIKAALVRASADESASVRERAVGGLALLPGDDVTNLLVELAERDAHRDPGGSLRAPRYPVREAARKALEKRGSNR